MPFLGLNQHNPASARLYGIAADDLIGRPVRAFDQDVRLDEAHDLRWCVLRKYHDRIDTLERGEDFSAFVFGRERPFGALVAPDRIVRVQPDNEHIAEGARVLEIADMARMEKVEHTIREDDTASGGARGGHECFGLRPGQHTGRAVCGPHGCSTRSNAMPSEKRQACRGR